MMLPMNVASGQKRYARLHQGEDAVSRYQRKLDNRIDRLRSTIEVEIFSKLLEGSVFDCTIGIGRFIGHVPKVTAYDGMDLSAEFVGHVRRLYPEVRALTGDLLSGIPVASASYDNVLCLRSLSGIGSLATILPEMVRVAKPGGLVIFDYGRRRTEIRVKGELTVLDGDDLDGIVNTLDATEVQRIRLDSVLTRAKIYARVFRFLTGPRGVLIPDAILLRMERWTAPLFWQRQIVVLRRRPAAL
jgi:SAM-dependent methyltransferase